MRISSRHVVMLCAALLGPTALLAAPRALTSVTLNGLEIGIAESTGAIVRLAHPATGVMMEASTADGGPISVACPVQDYIPMRLASPFSKARIESQDGAVTIRYEPLGQSRGHVRVPGDAVTATLTIRAADDRRSIILACTIENRSKAAIPQVLFPDLPGLRPFAGEGETLLRMANNAMNPFSGPPRPTEGAPFYGFQDGWKVFEYGGYYGPHVLRWCDLGGHRCGLSMFERRWGEGNIPSLLLQRIESDPQSLRLAWEHRVTIAASSSWKSAEFWLTPHVGGWAKGIEVFRHYVEQVNPRRKRPPRHVREGLGFQTPWLIQPMETDPSRAAFRYTDLPRIARDAKAHGIDEISIWGVFKSFCLPLKIDPRPGTAEEYLNAVREARAMGVNLCPFISVALLTKESGKRYGITAGAPAWVYDPGLIRNMDPYYQKSGVVGWEIAGAPLDNVTYQQDLITSFQTWIDQGATSFGWDVVCSKDGEGKRTILIDHLKKLRAAQAKDAEATLCGELVPNGNLEWDNQVLDYLWCWVPYTDADPLMNLFRAPRFSCTIEDHAVEVKKAFCAGLYMNLLPRKPDAPNGTALISEKPELSAALKEVAPLRRQFLSYFVDGTPLGDSILSTAVSAYVRGYQHKSSLLLCVLNSSAKKQDVALSVDLNHWLPKDASWKQVVFDGKGKRGMISDGAGRSGRTRSKILDPWNWHSLRFRDKGSRRIIPTQ